MSDPRTNGAAPTSTTPIADLNWLVRYAAHCGFHAGDDLTMIHALRHAFGGGGWRVLCRTPKAQFLPILRNRDLSIHSLMTYCRRLSENNFVWAPRAQLLEHFLTQRRAYFNLPCRIPQDEDYMLMRIADREASLRERDIALVSNWVNQAGINLTLRNKWSSLVARAKAYREREQVELAAEKSKPWYFYCRTTDWRGYVIEPIQNSAELWLEGTMLGTCLYKLRHECNALNPSRFFSIRRGGKRIATLELTWHKPRKEFIGMDRELGRWEIRDLRLSYNRLPHAHLQEAMEGFASMFNFWSKRSGRMPPGHVEEIRRRIKRLSHSNKPSAWNLSFPVQ